MSFELTATMIRMPCKQVRRRFTNLYRSHLVATPARFSQGRISGLPAPINRTQFFTFLDQQCPDLFGSSGEFVGGLVACEGMGPWRQCRPYMPPDAATRQRDEGLFTLTRDVNGI
jgi:hypothetical protein